MLIELAATTLSKERQLLALVETGRYSFCGPQSPMNAMSIFHNLEDRFIVFIVDQSYFLSRGCFGFVRWANGDILPIERSEFYLIRLLTFKPGERIDIEFSTATRHFAPTLQIEENSSVRLRGGDRRLGYDKTISTLVAGMCSLLTPVDSLIHEFPVGASSRFEWNRSERPNPVPQDHD